MAAPIILKYLRSFSTRLKLLSNSHSLKTYSRCRNLYEQQRRMITRGTNPLFHGEYEYQDPKSEEDVVNITYIDKNGESVPVRGKVGDNVMYLAHRYGIELEGACEASLACSTCHVYVDDAYTDRIQEPKEEEEDMLDMAPFLKVNSRLGCQIILSKDLDGIVVSLPAATRNFYVDGHVPQPH